jgi:hypothetical protein
MAPIGKPKRRIRVEPLPETTPRRERPEPRPVREPAEPARPERETVPA